MKRIIVSGGARGIGRAIVEELAPEGHKIIATFNNSDKAAKELAAKYPNVEFVEIDLTNREAVTRFIKEMSKEKIDVYIGNAGLWLGKIFEKNTEEELLEQVDLNFASQAQLMRGFLPALERSESGQMIIISSQAANPVFPGEAMYSASKAALSTLAKVLRAELNRKGIRLTTFEPWGVNTYGISEPSGMVKPKELAEIVRFVINTPSHLQLDTIGISHVKQWRGDFPEWVEQ